MCASHCCFCASFCIARYQIKRVSFVHVQPLAVDWREKLKTSKKAAAEPKRKPASVQQAPVTYNEKPDLEALSVGLPAGWKALWDKTSKEVYYANPKTKVGMLFFLSQQHAEATFLLLPWARKAVSISGSLCCTCASSVAQVEERPGSAEDCGRVPNGCRRIGEHALETGREALCSLWFEAEVSGDVLCPIMIQLLSGSRIRFLTYSCMLVSCELVV